MSRLNIQEPPHCGSNVAKNSLKLFRKIIWCVIILHMDILGVYAIEISFRELL